MFINITQFNASKLMILFVTLLMVFIFDLKGLAKYCLGVTPKVTRNATEKAQGDSYPNSTSSVLFSDGYRSGYYEWLR